MSGEEVCKLRSSNHMYIKLNHHRKAEPVPVGKKGWSWRKKGLGEGHTWAFEKQARSERRREGRVTELWGVGGSGCDGRMT